jgi:hypothetical protein
MVVKIKGKIEFNPPDHTNKHVSQSVWKKVAIIYTNCELDKYYAWFLKKRFNLELVQNIRGSHITFISDRVGDAELYNKVSNLFDGKEIDFYIELEPKSNGKHWWLRVHCPEAESIREIIGLNREPYAGLHLTLGHASPKNLHHSDYILEQCKKFNLISYENRKSLSEHEIITF